ncbi:unnamed protein product [Discula destructiva]
MRPIIRGFKFDEFDALCADLDADQLQLKWQHYTRALSAASSSTAVATLAAGPTGGISMIGAMIAGPLMHNARKKREIIEKHMTALGVEPETRKKDIYGPALISGILGGATAGIGMGAEALAVDKATKIIGHVVGDVVLTKVEERHANREHAKEVREHAEGQLIRTSTMPAMVPSVAFAKDKDFGEIALRHINSMPGTLGATANGLLASASRMKTHNYPLLKEYLSSVANQSKTYMSRDRSTMGQDMSGPSTASFGASTPPRSLDASLAAIEPASSEHSVPDALVSPLESTLDGEMDPGLVSPCEPEFAGVDEEHVFDKLLHTVDETTLAEIEVELELAIQEMDNPVTSFEDPADKRASRTFQTPTDLDQIVRRQSTRFQRRSVLYSQPPSDIPQDTLEQAYVPPPNMSRSGSYTASRRRPVPRTVREEPFDEADESPSPTGTMLPTYAEMDPSAAPEVRFGHQDSKRHNEEEFMDEKQVVDNHPSNPFTQSAEDVRAAQAPQVREWVDEKQAVRDPFLHQRHPSMTQGDPAFNPPPSYYATNEKEVLASTGPSHLRGGGLSHSDTTSSYASSSSRMIVSDPTDSELVFGPGSVTNITTTTTTTTTTTGDSESQTLRSVSSWSGRPPSPTLSTRSSSSTLSRTGSAALSAHNGMKKIGYFGMEPAAKLAIGGSLLLMGVRPSLQRKMLDKAKAKMGMPEKNAAAGSESVTTVPETRSNTAAPPVDMHIAEKEG